MYRPLSLGFRSFGFGAGILRILGLGGRREAALAGDKATGCFFAATAVAEFTDGRAVFRLWLLCASALRRSRALIRSSVACCT
jgi:hypothetical protein